MGVPGSRNSEPGGLVGATGQHLGIGKGHRRLFHNFFFYTTNNNTRRLTWYILKCLFGIDGGQHVT